jgi:hypothetical protein
LEREEDRRYMGKEEEEIDRKGRRGEYWKRRREEYSIR